MQRSGKDSRFLCCWLYLSVFFIAFRQSYKQASYCVEQLENVDGSGERVSRRKKNGTQLAKIEIDNLTERSLHANGQWRDFSAVFSFHMAFDMYSTLYKLNRITRTKCSFSKIDSHRFTERPNDVKQFFSHFKNGYKSSLFHLNWKGDMDRECTCVCVYVCGACIPLWSFCSSSFQIIRKWLAKPHRNTRTNTSLLSIQQWIYFALWNIDSYVEQCAQSVAAVASSKSSKNNAYCNVAHWHTLAEVFG